MDSRHPPRLPPTAPDPERSLPAEPTQAMREVLATWGPALRRLCRGHEADAIRREDLHQDILVALWRALPRFRGDASLKTYVFRVAHHTALKHRRSGARDRHVPTEDLGRRLVDPTPGVGARLDAARRRARLEAAVQGLPDLDRELVLLHLEGLSHREVGEVTGLSPSNVSTRLSRLRTRLRRTLEAPDVP